ncbi:MAG: LamG domain-containing protein [Candidatus Moraniibacteriota bacterium]|nr:MAG: LamG domain-containing protein [Candidatus Moranbacteria bacterium]
MYKNTSRFLQWTLITLVLSIVAGLYFWYGSKAGVSIDTPSITDTTVTSGLIAHYTFDPPDVVWSDAISEIKDHTGNGYHFNAVGLGESNLELGHIGQALNFIPGNATSLLRTEAAFDALATGSISMWIKWDGTSVGTSGTLLDRGDCGSNNGQFQLYMDMAASAIGLWMTAVSAGCSATVDAETTLAISDPKAWHHIVFTDSSSGHVVYIDGSPQALSYTSGSSSVDFFFDNVGGSQEYQIGRNSSEEFGGLIDDVRIYNRAISASEVYQLYTTGTAKVNAPTEDPLSQSLRGYWKLDTGSGTSATDSSGNGNTLAMTGSPGWVTGNIGPYALDFSGSGQYLSIASPSSALDFADGASFTLTGWFNRDTFTSDHTILSTKSGQSTESDGYIAYIDDATGQLIIRFDENGTTEARTFTSSSTFTIATGWHNFALSWNESAPDAVLYIDGKPDGSGSGTVFASMGNLSNTNAFYIGAETDAGNPFDGKLDDIRIYGYALSADQVKKIYNTTSPTQPIDTSLVGHWTFDGADVDSANGIVRDKSRSGNDGTFNTPYVSPAVGKSGQGISFDGTGWEFIPLASMRNLEMGTGDMTVNVWVRLVSSNADTYFVNKKDSGLESGEGYSFYYSNSLSSLVVLIGTGSAHTYYDTSTASLQDDQWHMVSYVVDRDAGISFYLDGTFLDMDGTSVYNGTDITNASEYPGLGYSDGNGDVVSYDDIRIYNRVLSSDEISNLYRIM